MHVIFGQILQKSATEKDMDELHAFADTDHGLFAHKGELQKLKLHQIQHTVGRLCACGCFSIKGGIKVAAAGQKEQIKRKVLQAAVWKGFPCTIGKHLCVHTAFLYELIISSVDIHGSGDQDQRFHKKQAPASFFILYAVY